MTFREMLGSAAILLLARSPQAPTYRFPPDRDRPQQRPLVRSNPGQQSQHIEATPRSLPRWLAWCDVRYWFVVAPIFLTSDLKIFRLSSKEKTAYLALRKHGLFDKAWYLDRYPDIAASKVDPLHHFLRHGLYEGRSPNRQIIGDAPKGEMKDRSGQNNRTPDRYLSIVSGLYESEASNLAAVGHVVHTIDKGYLKHMSDRIVQRGLERFETFCLFKSNDYLALNEPLRAAIGLVPHHHAFMYGFAEGRTIFNRHTIANELGRRARLGYARNDSANVVDARTPGLSVSILYNAAGNSFLHDIASSILYDLRSDGHDAVLIDERDDPGAMRDHNIIVAPHEFFFLGRGQNWNRDDVVSRSVMLNTEQPQTVWFDRAVAFNLLSRGVIDLSTQVAAIYNDSMPAIQCDPNGPPLDDVLPDPRDPFFRMLPRGAKTIGHARSPFETRALDASFFGGISDHRERFFARTARFFSDYKTIFYCRRDGRPLPKDGTTDLLAAARHAAFHSKIVLNIHRDEFGFFEWHRIVRLGIETGAVVVSEPCLPHPDFKPGVHYLEESGRHIQNLVEWLLNTSDGHAQAAKIRAEALNLVDGKRRRKQAGRRIARFLEGSVG